MRGPCRRLTLSIWWSSKPPSTRRQRLPHSRGAALAPNSPPPTRMHLRSCQPTIRFAALTVAVVVGVAGCSSSYAPASKSPPVGQPPRWQPASPPSLPPGIAGDHLYVALGDSYSSGEGAPQYRTGDYLQGTETATDHCHRSTEAYPSKVAALLGSGWGFLSAACSGAQIKSYYPSSAADPYGPRFQSEPGQLIWLDLLKKQKRAPDLVTLTAGGNNLGISLIITTCLLGAAVRTGSDTLLLHVPPPMTVQPNHGCAELQERPVSRGLTYLRDHLPKLYTDVQQHAGIGPGTHGRVLVVGYPRPFRPDPPLGCRTGLPGGSWSRSDMQFLNSFADRINQAIAAAAKEVPGVDYVDVSDLLMQGGPHDLCVNNSRQRWLNRLQVTDGRGHSVHQEGSFHPTIAAHDAEARLVYDCYALNLCSFASDRGIGSVDWTKAITDMDCSTYGHGLQVDAKVTGDITGDGRPDVVVAVACVALTSSWPDKVFVYDGASDPSEPRRIATLLDYRDGTDDRGLRVRGMDIRESTVTVRSLSYAPQDPNAFLSRQVSDSFQWTGTGFQRGGRHVTSADAVAPSPAVDPVQVLALLALRQCNETPPPPGEKCTTGKAAVSARDPRFGVGFASTDGHEGTLFRRSSPDSADFTAILQLAGDPPTCTEVSLAGVPDGVRDELIGTCSRS